MFHLSNFMCYIRSKWEFLGTIQSLGYQLNKNKKTKNLLFSSFSFVQWQEQSRWQ